MNLRRSLGAVVVALAVVGALGASAWAAPAKVKPKHRPAKKAMCTIGQQPGKQHCLPNPAYAKSACAAWTPAVEAFLGGPAQLSPAGNAAGIATDIGCAWRAAGDLARVQGGTPLGEVPLTLSFSAYATTAAEFKKELAQIQQEAAMSLAELQQQYASGKLNPCTVSGPNDEQVVPFDAPQMLSGLGGLAYSWDTCSKALTGLPDCSSPTLPKDKYTGLPTVTCARNGPSPGVWWDSSVNVLRGKVAYSVSIQRPEMTISDDQLATFLETVMAKYH